MSFHQIGVWRAGAALLSALALAGCQSGGGGGGTHEREDSPSASAAAASDPLGRGPEAQASDTPLTLRDVWPHIAAQGRDAASWGSATSRVTRYAVVEGPHAGKVLELTQTPGEEAGTWTVTRRVVGQEQPLERRVVRLVEDEDLYLTAFWNDERGVRVVFEPDPLFARGTMRPGEVIEGRQKLTLPTIANPKKIRERGTGETRLVYEGRQQMDVAGRPVECARTREVYISRLKNATAERTIVRWYGPGIGLVAERWEETVTIFGGIVAERSVLAIRLAGEPGGEDRTFIPR